MECPNCKKALQIPTYAQHNAESYTNPVVVKTMCCGVFVRLVPVRTYEVYVYRGDRKDDDWGNKL